MPGEGLTHGPPATKNAGGSHHRISRINRHSLRNGFNGLSSRSPRCTGLDSHRRPRIIFRRLDPSVGRSGPRDFAVRTGRARLAPPIRPSHPAPTLRDDRDTPLCRSGMCRDNHKIRKNGSEIFLVGRLDHATRLRSFNKIARRRMMVRGKICAWHRLDGWKSIRLICPTGQIGLSAQPNDLARCDLPVTIGSRPSTR